LNADDLVDLARAILLQVGGHAPKLVVINRAISTAYYAVFHALCWEIVDRTVRRRPSDRFWDIVEPVYRSLDHGSAKRVFQTISNDRGTPEPLKRLSLAFIDLQVARVDADYNPRSRFTRREALDFVERSKQAIETLRLLPPEDRTVLAVKLLTKQR
jgi:hypothetical protein